MKFAVGETVGIVGNTRRFEVIEGPNNRGMYLIRRNSLEMWVDGSQLMELKPGKKRSKTTSRKEILSQATEVLRIDLHGMRAEEAKEAVLDLLSRGLLENAASLEIIHGLGTGTLERAVHSVLKNSKHVKAFHVQALNPGTTMVYL